MKNGRLLALFLAAAMLCCLFAGCGAESSGAYADSVVEATGAGKDIYDTGSTDSVAVTDRKLIRRISLDVETEELDPLISAIEKKVSELGGYVESREVYTGSAYASYEQRRYADLTLRIPAENLDAFVSHVGDVSNVTASSESAEDVTLNYVATESRMKALQAEESRLLALIEKAENLTELLQLESRLTEIRTELEEVTSTLRLYDNLVDYGTVQLDISEVTVLTPTEEPGVGQRMADGFVGSLGNLGAMATEFAIFVVSGLPYLAVLLVIAGVVLLVVKKSKKKSKDTPPSGEKEQK